MRVVSVESSSSVIAQLPFGARFLVPLVVGLGRETTRTRGARDAATTVARVADDHTHKQRLRCARMLWSSAKSSVQRVHGTRQRFECATRSCARRSTHDLDVAAHQRHTNVAAVTHVKRLEDEGVQYRDVVAPMLREAARLAERAQALGALVADALYLVHDHVLVHPVARRRSASPTVRSPATERT